MRDIGKVGFDLKAYAEVDHGYAATIHKAQGVTVDAAHVLATPGMDRHSAYVALSRHRDGVALHYGRDDFESLGAVARTLGRERAKDMASDYGIEPESSPARAKGAEPSHDVLVERHARAVADALRRRDQNLPLLSHQSDALKRSRGALAPGEAKDLERAYLDDRSLLGEAVAGRTRRVLQVVQLEAEIRSQTQARADAFVERWKGVVRQRDDLYRSGEYLIPMSIDSVTGPAAWAARARPNWTRRSRSIWLNFRFPSSRFNISRVACFERPGALPTSHMSAMRRSIKSPNGRHASGAGGGWRLSAVHAAFGLARPAPGVFASDEGLA